MTATFEAAPRRHVPVLLNEVIAALGPIEGGTFVDAPSAPAAIPVRFSRRAPAR
ncbi:hypothetical protein A6302_01081 [Methylobrevis pamukkalensis]|uniref:Uncharacterized protein n=1 Tax=Methylobrevis pamukkalensis TaxID=1439726 RepID=A0A1E3H5G1_9HYPH|nr:hypothetical protein A6302_01081 [Methylobrevis pamukkalensis]